MLMIDTQREILGDRYLFKWIGRLTFSKADQSNDKVWGFFHYIDPTLSGRLESASQGKYVYVFWADLGKTLKFKRHIDHGPSLNRLVMRKVSKNGYERIPLHELTTHWPNMHTMINSQFVFYLLSENA